MEHRWSERRRVCIDVKIYHNGNSVALCKTRDLSMGGMQIRVGPLGFYTNTPLEVEFEVQADGGARRYRLPCNVVHCSRDRLGVMIHETHAEAHAALSRLHGDAVSPDWNTLAGEVRSPARHARAPF